MTTLKSFGSIQSVPSITVDSSMSPQTENGCHRILFDDIQILKNKAFYLSSELESDPFASFHSYLKNFHSDVVYDTINSGFCLKSVNSRIIGSFSESISQDLFRTFNTDADEDFYRMKRSVFLFHDGKEFMQFPVSEYIAYMGIPNGITKLFMNGSVSFPSDFDPTKYRSGIPIYGFILDHNLSTTSPEFIVLGINNAFELGVYKYTVATGFVLKRSYSAYYNHLFGSFGRLNYSGTSFYFARNLKKSFHYGLDQNPGNRLVNQFYYWTPGLNGAEEDDTDIALFTDSMKALTDNLSIGLYICPEYNFEIHNFDYGYDYQGW